MMGSVALEEFELMKDTKYRMYVSNVDKALKAFENTNEWPDLISALGKLHKTIKEHQRFPVIPRRIKIGKRLAQCMYFQLPAGVHLKALEIYDTIFKCMGTNRLSHELFIYSAGLFPLLGPSAILVKPKLLTIYETHFVPLGSRLLPGLSGFLSGVLPGLEEGSDHFDRTNALLGKVCEGVGPINFYGCLWECIVANASVRLPAVTFVLSHFNKRAPMEEQKYIMGPKIDTMVQALCAGMQDNNVLVQRSALDLLMMGFPMHSHQISERDMICLVTSALGTVLRRDISLNRRLYAWLMGSEIDVASLPSDHLFVRKLDDYPDEPRTSIYFELYSKNLLIEGVKQTLQLSIYQLDVRPYRLLTSLLDKSDVGPVILDDILYEVFRLFFLTANHLKKSDLIKSANLFFGSLESSYIWQYIGSLFEEACRAILNDLTTICEVNECKEVRSIGSGLPNLWEICELCEFLLNHVPVEITPHSPCEHLISLLIRLIHLLTKYLDHLQEDQLARCLSVCRMILLKMQPVKKAEDEEKNEDSPEEISYDHTGFQTFLQDFENFYAQFISRDRILNHAFVNQAFQLLLKKSHLLSQELLGSLIPQKIQKWSECFRLASVLLVESYQALWCLPDESKDFVQTFWMKALIVACCYLRRSPEIQLIAVKTFLDLLTKSQTNNEIISPRLIFLIKDTTVVSVIADALWNHLKTNCSEMQMRSIRMLYELQYLFHFDDAVETVIGDSLLEGDEASRLDALQRFIMLYTAGRDLLVSREYRSFQQLTLRVLDNLQQTSTNALYFRTVSWLSQALLHGGLSRLVDPLLLILLNPSTARLGVLHSSVHDQVEDCDKVSGRLWRIRDLCGGVLWHFGHSPKRVKSRWKRESASYSALKVHIESSISKSKSESHLRLIGEGSLDRDVELPKSSNVSLVLSPFHNQHQVLPDDEVKLIKFKRHSPPLKATNSKESLKSLFYGTSPDFEDALSFNETQSIFTVVNNILQDIIDGVVEKCESPERVCETAIHPLHSHLLLYCDIYDYHRVLYAFETLKRFIKTNPRLFLCCASTSGIACASYPQDILHLLARHRKSVFGKGFEGDLSSAQEYVAIYRSSMYLEVLVSVCLHFARSFYPNSGLPKLSPEALEGNRLVQLTSIETLGIIFEELIPIVKDSGRGFANYIYDLLIRCKVQKAVLHSAMASISYIQQQQLGFSETKTFTEDIIEFNDPPRSDNKITEHSRAVQVNIVKVISSLIKLEHHVELQKSDSSETTQTKDAELGEDSYTANYLIPQQKMFTRAVTAALTLKGSMRYLHHLWTDLITVALPYLGSALPDIVFGVIRQLCLNIEFLIEDCLSSTSDKDLPPDYVISQVESLMVLCHYCILDSSLQVSPLSLASSTGLGLIQNSTSSPQILSNLVHVFTTLPLIQDLSKEKNNQLETLLIARRRVLGNLPYVITSLARLWQTTTEDSCQRSKISPLCGSARVVRSQILEFLSPISLHHGPSFLAAVAVVWQNRKNANFKQQVLPVPTEDQLILVDLISSIKEMHTDNLVQTVHNVLKQPPIVEGEAQEMSVDVSVLELFFVYVKNTSGEQLIECWASLLNLLRDGLSLQPPGLLLVLAILNEFVQKSPTFPEKKDQRDLQDITAKLVEACGDVAGACLVQTTWLRRNLAVKDSDNFDESDTTLQQYSVNAQTVLAQVLAPLLDVSYGSQEKEKVAQILVTLMYNITPYLKNHSPKYASSFLACSQLLASLSSYQYTRKAWKKDAFELLLDPALFQMDLECLPCWVVIIDNLMTHDMTTFRDLTSRISVAQSGSYNLLFSSREQEYEQRAQLLKRLAFVIMCSEVDQYHKFMHIIQDRLSESLRLPQVVPLIQAQVFFCFRVLLLRMSPHHVISLWPSIITELVQVFANVEKELTTETEEFSSHIKLMSGLDSSWVVNSNNGLNAHGHPHWLLLTLSAAKLLDLAVLLPTQMLPQFQMYKWAFVGDPIRTDHDFVPYVNRISRLMEEKYGPCKDQPAVSDDQPLLMESTIDHLQQLQYFFNTVGNRNTSPLVDMKSIENSIQKDFLDKIQVH